MHIYLHIDFPISRARGIVFNIVGGEDMTLQEINSAAEVIYENVDPDANIIFGALVDEKITNNEVSITVLATGFSTDFFDYEESSQSQATIQKAAVAPPAPKITPPRANDMSNLLNSARAPTASMKRLPTAGSSANDWRKAKRDDVAKDMMKQRQQEQENPATRLARAAPLASSTDEEDTPPARGNPPRPVRRTSSSRDSVEDEESEPENNKREVEMEQVRRRKVSRQPRLSYEDNRGEEEDAEEVFEENRRRPVRKIERETSRDDRKNAEEKPPKKKAKGIRGLIQRVFGRFFK